VGFGGWVLMLTTWTFIISLAVFCFSRIFRKGIGGEDRDKNPDINNSDPELR